MEEILKSILKQNKIHTRNIDDENLGYDELAFTITHFVFNIAKMLAILNINEPKLSDIEMVLALIFISDDEFVDDMKLLKKDTYSISDEFIEQLDKIASSNYSVKLKKQVAKYIANVIIFVIEEVIPKKAAKKLGAREISSEFKNFVVDKCNPFVM